MDPRYVFQWLNAAPPILNVGCESDPAMLYAAPGTVNCDIDDWSGTTPAFLRMDACQAPWPFADKSFDTVVMSDCLDHMEAPVVALIEARRVARRAIVITLPKDVPTAEGAENHLEHVEDLKKMGLRECAPGDLHRRHAHFDHWTEEKVRALLEPKPVGEASTEKFRSVQEVHAAAGVKIAAPGLDDALSGSPVRHYSKAAEKEIMEEIQKIKIDSDSVGPIVRSNTLGSLEAIVKLLQDRGIKVKKADVGEAALTPAASAPVGQTQPGQSVPEAPGQTNALPVSESSASVTNVSAAGTNCLKYSKLSFVYPV